MHVGHDPRKGLLVVDSGAHDSLLGLWRDFHGPGTVGAIEKLAEAFSDALWNHPVFQAHRLK